MRALKVGSVNSQFILKYGYAEALKRSRACGFDSVDFSFFANQAKEDFVLKKTDAELKKFCTELRTVAEDIGLDIGQTHAPYYFIPPETYCDWEFVKIFAQAIKATAWLGSKYVVVHPALYKDAENNYMRSFETNRTYYGMLKPVANDFGVTVAIENMCAINPLKNTGVPSATSTAEKLSHIVDEMGEGFCACLDTGHAFYCGQQPADFARRLGKRLQVLHMQDGDGNDDLHVPPTLGRIDWADFLRALKEIDYQGVLNMESSYSRFGGVDNLMETGRFLSALGKDFARRIEEM